MGKRKNILLIILLLLLIVVVICAPQPMLQGARDGLSLCLYSVIPSLFPFVFLSILLGTTVSSENWISIPILARILGIPQGAEVLFINSLISGYPIGAHTVYENYRHRNLGKADAQRMLGFCNNAGPSFIFGMLSSLFPSKGYLWLLWIIHIVSALLTGIVLPNRTSNKIVPVTNAKPNITATLQQAIRAISTICGWVILFRILISYLNLNYTKVPGIILSGILELTNGCCLLSGVERIPFRFLICSSLLSFGGCCVVLQTASVTNELGIKNYLCGKFLQTLFSIFFSSALVVKSVMLTLIAFLATIIYIVMLRKNNSRKLQSHVV